MTLLPQWNRPWYGSCNCNHALVELTLLRCHFQVPYVFRLGQPGRRAEMVCPSFGAPTVALHPRSGPPPPPRNAVLLSFTLS